MQIGAMNNPARDPVGEIEWIGKNGFDFVDFTREPPAPLPTPFPPAGPISNEPSVPSGASRLSLLIRFSCRPGLVLAVRSLAPGQVLAYW